MLRQEETKLLSKECGLESLARRAITSHSDTGRSLWETGEDPVSTLACQLDVLKTVATFGKSFQIFQSGWEFCQRLQWGQSLIPVVFGVLGPPLSELVSGKERHSGSEL